MKKLVYLMLVLATVAFGFSSCEQVPMPYDTPSGPNNPDNPDELPQEGDGSATAPFNVAAANALIASGDYDPEKSFYVKGIITSIEEGVPNSFGNATYFISDDNGATNKLEVYRGYGFNGAKITSADDIKVGDEVIVLGKLVNYSGTFEITQGSKIVYQNGNSVIGGGTPEGDGTQANPYNVAAALELVSALPADGKTEGDIYVKGKIVSISNVDTGTFGNANYYISDDGTANGQIYIFQSLYLNKEKFTSADQIKVGDDVIICGPFVNFKGNTPETVGKGSSYLYSLNGETSGSGGTDPTPGEPSGDGTQANPYNVAKALEVVSALSSEDKTEPIYVKGIISSIKQVDTGQYGNANYYISDDGTANGQIYIFQSLYLNKEKFTSADQIKVGDEVVIYGPFVNFMGNTPETAGKGESYLYSLNGKSEGGSGGDEGGETPSGDQVTINPGDFGLADATAIGEKTLQGVKFSFDKGTNNNEPKYYQLAGGTIRMYPTNKVTIDAGSKKIAKITFTCDSYNGTDYTAEGMATCTPGNASLENLVYTFSDINSGQVTITNGNSSTGGKSQIRIKTMTITFAE